MQCVRTGELVMLVSFVRTSIKDWARVTEEEVGKLQTDRLFLMTNKSL